METDHSELTKSDGEPFQVKNHFRKSPKMHGIHGNQLNFYATAAPAAARRQMGGTRNSAPAKDLLNKNPCDVRAGQKWGGGQNQSNNQIAI